MKQLLNNILNITIALRQQNQISQLNIRELTDRGRMTLFLKIPRDSGVLELLKANKK